MIKTFCDVCNAESSKQNNIKCFELYESKEGGLGKGGYNSIVWRKDLCHKCQQTLNILKHVNTYKTKT